LGAARTRPSHGGRRRSRRGHVPAWELVREYVEDQVAIGRYPPGAWLPSVRELARELNINRNTVSKVYLSLASNGVLEAVPGLGVRAPRGVSSSGSREGQLQAEIESLVRVARLQGVNREWLLDRVFEVTRDAYAKLAVKVSFVECDLEEARVLAQNLSEHLGIEVAPIVLSHLVTDPRGLADGQDIVATASYHLPEVSAALRGTKTRIVGMDAAPSHETLLRIARMAETGKTIVIVCRNDRTLEQVQRTVALHARGRIVGHTINDGTRLQSDLEAADVVITDYVTKEAVSRMSTRAELITVRFQIEKRSIESLRETVLEHNAVRRA
jgi:GntR family transcriptional regulator